MKLIFVLKLFHFVQHNNKKMQSHSNNEKKKLNKYVKYNNKNSISNNNNNKRLRTHICTAGQQMKLNERLDCGLWISKSNQTKLNQKHIEKTTNNNNKNTSHTQIDIVSEIK